MICETWASISFPTHDTSVLQNHVFQTISLYLASVSAPKILLLCVFGLFLLTSVQSSKSTWGFFQTLSMYSSTFYVVMISMRTDLVPRSMCGICSVTWRNFIRMCIWTFSNSLQVNLGMLPHTSTPYRSIVGEVILEDPTFSFSTIPYHLQCKVPSFLLSSHV